MARIHLDETFDNLLQAGLELGEIVGSDVSGKRLMELVNAFNEAYRVASESAVKHWADLVEMVFRTEYLRNPELILRLMEMDMKFGEDYRK